MLRSRLKPSIFILNHEDENENEDCKNIHELSHVKAMVERLTDLTNVNDSDSRTVKLWKSYLQNTSIPEECYNLQRVLEIMTYMYSSLNE